MVDQANFADTEEITGFVAQLPSAKLEAPEAYPRGTVLTLTVQVRVKSAFTDEDRKGNLFVRHNLVIEDVAITDTLTPAQRRALLEAAEAQLAAEQPTLDEALITETDDAPLVDQLTVAVEDRVIESVDPEPSPDDTAEMVTRPFIYIAPNQAPASDDDDDEHAWMDEEPDGLNIDIRAVVGF